MNNFATNISVLHGNESQNKILAGIHVLVII